MFRNLEEKVFATVMVLFTVILFVAVIYSIVGLVYEVNKMIKQPIKKQEQSCLMK